MNCSLTDKEREKGNRCRSFDCIPCKDFNLSVNDATIINVHMDNMRLKEENKQLKINLGVCKHDYWFMSNLLERCNGNEESVKDCIERMKFRKPLFSIAELNKEER